MNNRLEQLGRVFALGLAMLEAVQSELESL